MPLSQASGNRYYAVAKLLIENGALPNPASLLEAVINGHEAVVKLLLDNGAHLGAKDWNGQTPLLQAARNGHKAVVELLLENGGEPDVDLL